MQARPQVAAGCIVLLGHGARRAVQRRSAAEAALLGVGIEASVEERRCAEAAAGQERIVGDDPHPHPPKPGIQPLGVRASGIEHEHRLAELAREVLRRAQDRSSNASTPCAAMHQHLRQVRAMRLIFRQVESQLRRADDAARILCDEQRALAACCSCRYPVPNPWPSRRSKGS